MTAILTTPAVSSWRPFSANGVTAIECKVLKTTETERYESWRFRDGSTVLVMIKDGTHYVHADSRVFEHDYIPAWTWIEPAPSDWRERLMRGIASVGPCRVETKAEYDEWARRASALDRAG